MNYKRVLTIQDISCVGQCSLTVALPVLSACGQETCILPSAVLSTHTGGFEGPTFRDLSQDVPAIWAHWQKEKITFDAVYTGYLGTLQQIGMVGKILEEARCQGSLTVADPAMADHGKLYKGFDETYAAAMGQLCVSADIMIPNITEACMITGMDFRTEYDETYIHQLLNALADMGAKCVVLTGVSLSPGMTGVALYKDGAVKFYSHEKIDRNYHGTGDLFASAFVGALLSGRTDEDAMGIAAEFTALCIRKTVDDPNHWYGVKFETAFPELIRMLQEN